MGRAFRTHLCTGCADQLSEEKRGAAGRSAGVSGDRVVSADSVRRVPGQCSLMRGRADLAARARRLIIRTVPKKSCSSVYTRRNDLPGS